MLARGVLWTALAENTGMVMNSPSDEEAGEEDRRPIRILEHSRIEVRDEAAPAMVK